VEKDLGRVPIFYVDNSTKVTERIKRRRLQLGMDPPLLLALVVEKSQTARTARTVRITQEEIENDWEWTLDSNWEWTLYY
jgi:hypothetical protein